MLKKFWKLQQVQDFRLYWPGYEGLNWVTEVHYVSKYLLESSKYLLES